MSHSKYLGVLFIEKTVYVIIIIIIHTAKRKPSFITYHLKNPLIYKTKIQELSPKVILMIKGETKHLSPLQCSCQENPRDGGSLVGCHPWGRTELDTAEATQQSRAEKHLFVLVTFKCSINVSYCCLHYVKPHLRIRIKIFTEPTL